MPKSKAIDETTRQAEWDGESELRFPEGLRTHEERKFQYKNLAGTPDFDLDLAFKEAVLEPEPPLTAEQYVLCYLGHTYGWQLLTYCRIHDVEQQIGAGLIEEVIQVAEGEHVLVDEMIKSKA